MDRIDFLRSIDQAGKDSVTELISFFDQFMAMYSLVGSYSNMDISNNESTQSFIRFTVSFDEPEKINLLQQAIINTHNIINVYGNTYKIDYTIISIKSISIILSKI